jgi:FG-GAP repeat
MSMQTGKKTTNGIKSSPRRIIPRFGAPVVIAALMCSALLVTAARASSLIDPDPENSTTLFGNSVAVVGDVNGDGVPDLAVGAPFQDGDFDIENGFGPPQDVGKVWLISGANLGVIRQLNDPFFQEAVPNKFGGFFGFSVAGVGDLNNDGVPDVLVGVPHHSNFDTDAINAGEAIVFSGANGRAVFTLTDPDEDENNRMGYSVAGLGDVNGDGVNDMVVGSPKKDTEEGLVDVGSALIFSGANGSLIRSLDPPAQGGAEANGRFGTAVANAGDVNGDGVSDILIGAPGDSRAYVFNGATGALIFTISSPASPGADRLPSFGAAVAGGQDLNGDGKPDFAIGAPLQNSLSGAAYIFNGSNGTLQRRLRATSHGMAKFGSSVALSPDLSGDGRPDILVGVPDIAVNGLQNAGEVLIFRGSNGRLFRTLTSEEPTAVAGFGYAVTTGDFNGDGTPETVIGVPFQDKDLLINGDVETHLQIGQIEIQ